MYPGHWAEQFPDKPALIDSATGETVTFRELDERSNQLSQLMWSRGLRPGDHVAGFMENNLRYFDLIWAALRSGLHLTPINSYLSDEEAGFILDNCGAKLLLTSRRLKEVGCSLPKFAPRCINWLMVGGVENGYEDYLTAVAEYSAEPLAEQPEGNFMLYSSGTTGRPKGIKRPLSGTHINEGSVTLGVAQKMMWQFDQDSVYLSPAPLYHAAPMAFSAGTHVLGGTVVMMPKFEESAALEAIENYQVTHSQMVPTMFTRMLKLPEAQRTGFNLSSLKVVLHSAAPCPQGVKQQMLDWWGAIIYEYYSSTEGVGFTHCTPEEWLERPGTVGRPVAGIPHICDESGKELAAGEAGILYFETPENEFTYHEEKAKTNDTQHPEYPSWKTVGDMGYLDDDGYLYLTDRATFMIISGGVNIYPQEIEDQLIMHPKVEDVAVIGIPDAEMGEAVKAVVQTVHGVEENDALAEELIAYTRQHIAHFKCPRSVDFIDELPRLPTGKLYKRLIKDAYWEQSGTGIV